MDASGSAAGLALIAVELLRSVPALRRVQRTKVSDGVSGTSLGVLTGTGLAWVFFALLVESWWVLAANIVWLSIHMFLCKAVATTSGRKGRAILKAALLSVGIFILSVLTVQFFLPIEDAFGLVLGLSTLFYAVPAVVEGLTSKTTRGLSLLSLGVNSIEGLIYLAGGLGVVSLGSSDDAILGFIIFGFISAVSNGTRLVRVSWRRFRRLDHATTAL